LPFPTSARHNSFFGDLWHLKVATLEGGEGPTLQHGCWRCVETSGTGPGERAHHDGCILGDRYLMIHGGLRPQGYRDNDTFILDLHQEPPRWSEILPGRVQSPARPVARFHHSFTPLRDRRRVVLLGGHDRTISAISSLAIFSIAPQRAASEALPTWELLPDGEGPDSRARHTTSPIGPSGAVVFGGNVGSNRTGAAEHPETVNDLWFFEADTHAWTQLAPAAGPSPSGRQYHCSIVTEANILIVCGGCDWRGFPAADNDFCWMLDLSSLQRDLTTPLPPWQSIAASSQSLRSAGRLGATMLPSNDGHVLALGGHTSQYAMFFDHFGDPVTFADFSATIGSDDGLGSPHPGFGAEVIVCHSALGQPCRRVGQELRSPRGGSSSSSTFRACGAASCGRGGGVVVLAMRSDPGTDGGAQMLAFALRLSGALPGELQLGAEVELQGLQGREDLNGTRAVYDAFVPDRKRCAVRLASGKVLSVQRQNLRVVEK